MCCWNVVSSLVVKLEPGQIEVVFGLVVLQSTTAIESYRCIAEAYRMVQVNLLSNQRRQGRWRRRQEKAGTCIPVTSIRKG